jgi:hypothetical protein
LTLTCKHIEAALRKLEPMDGWPEDRTTIKGHLTRGWKRVRELDQKLRVSR